MAARACQSLCCAAQLTAGASRPAAQLAAAPPPPPLRAATAARPRRSVAAAAADNSDAEVAVFRFTLGSDVADALVPRVVGGVGAALLLLNHLLGDQPSEAQASWHCRLFAGSYHDSDHTQPTTVCEHTCATGAARCVGHSMIVKAQAQICGASLTWSVPYPTLPRQLRAEALGAVLAAVAFVTPTIEQRLKELQPGRGRQAAAVSVPGAASVFALQPGLPDSLKQVSTRLVAFRVWCLAKGALARWLHMCLQA